MGMFDTPKTIVPAPKKALEKKKTEVEISGLEQLAMINALQETLETLRATVEAEVKAVASERFIQHITATGKRPENFTAVDGGAMASIQFRRKSSSTALSAETIELLRANNIEPAKIVGTQKLFAINPEHAGNTELLGKVEAALAGIVPENFIMVQEEASKLVATEETFDAAIAAKAPAEVIKALSTISCGPKLKNTNLNAILTFVSDLIDAPAFGAAASQAKETKTLRLVVA